MARGNVNVFEQHVEKGILGLAFVFLLAMAFLYLIQTPNQIDYGGQTVTPDELPAAIEQDAEQLEARMARTEPPNETVPLYSEELEQRQNAGIFAEEEASPVLAARLPLTSPFNAPVPKLAEDEEASANITLVTPLKPTALVPSTGRSRVIPQAPADAVLASFSPGGGDRLPDEELPDPVELPWVTVGAYFDRAAQKQEMNKANYAPYRQRVYLAGLEVQRQEKLATGEWSEWQPVTGSNAMPDVEIPDPVVNEISGEIENSDEIKQAYDLVKAAQASLVQPTFFEVQAGDFWEIPELPGFEQEMEEEEQEPAPRPRAEPREPRPSRRPGGGGGGGPPIAGTGGPPIAGMGGGGTTVRRPQGDDRNRIREARQEIQKSLAEAKQALAQQSYSEARSLLQRVIDHQYASSGDERQAKRLLARVEQMERRSGGGGGGGGGGAPPIAEMGAPPIAGMGARSTAGSTAKSGQDSTLITHPEDSNKVALWFHDDTVEAGKTYRYRMRAKIWNRYVGKPRALARPEQAEQTLLVGEWSLPSGSVTVTPSTYFFASSPAPDRSSARVEVWKWYDGLWLRESFNVAVGDTIGNVSKVKTGRIDGDGREMREDVDFTTGAIVLDLLFDEPVMLRSSAGKEGEFNIRETQSLVLVYLDPADGQVKRRVQAFDRYDAVYQKLKNQEL